MQRFYVERLHVRSKKQVFFIQFIIDLPKVKMQTKAVIFCIFERIFELLQKCTTLVSQPGGRILSFLINFSIFFPL